MGTAPSRLVGRQPAESGDIAMGDDSHIPTFVCP